MFDYVYYKLYQAALKSSVKDIPHLTASAWLGGLIGANIFVINGFLAKIFTTPFLFSNPKQAGLFTLALIVLIALYFKENKRSNILSKYAQESNKERKKGNAIIAIYVALSFLLIFAVAFFKPNKGTQIKPIASIICNFRRHKPYVL